MSRTALFKTLCVKGGTHPGRLLICDAEDRLLGSIWYFQAVPYYDGLEIGYHLFDVGRRNTGVMTDALFLLAHYLFSARQINRLQLAIMQPNAASKRVAEQCGFTFEGVARGAIFHRGANHDLEIYSLVRVDLRSSEVPREPGEGKSGAESVCFPASGQEQEGVPGSVSEPAPNKGVQATAASVRSCLAPAASRA